MLDAVNKAADGKDPKKEIEATVEAELRADVIENDLRKRIGSGQMSVLQGRDAMLEMVSKQDRIADYAQNVAEQLSFRELFGDKKARKMLKEMAEAVSNTASLYEDTISQLKTVALSGYTKAGRQRLSDLIDAVNLAEHQADVVESKAAAYVFSNGEEESLAAMHMYRVLQRLDDVANACEKAANTLLSIVYD